MKELINYSTGTRRVQVKNQLASWRNTRALLAAFFLFTTSVIAQNPNPKGVPGKAGDFEIDGDFISGNCTTPTCVSTGIDWRSVLKQTTPPSGYAIPGETNVANENAIWIVDGNSGSGVIASNIEVETFAGTSNKNGNFIAPGQSPYSIDTSNPSAPQKNDLTNIYVRSKEVSGDTWLHMGAETRSVDGTSYLDFEYNQAGISKTTTQMFGPASLATTGGRTPRVGTVAGDLLFVVDFSKGGNTPIPLVFEWQQVTKANKTTYAWVNIPIPAGLAYIVTNGNDVEPAGDNTAFAGDGSASNTTMALQFVEMGVNLTDLFGTFDPCSPDATMLVKTRTSSSYTSELKDFSLFNFAIVPPALMQDIDPVAVCPGEDALFVATVSGSGASGANIDWYKVVTPDDPNTMANEEVLSSELVTGGRITITTAALSSTLAIADVEAGDAGTYKAVLTGATCGAPFEYTTLTINTIDDPIVTLLEPSICDSRPTGTLSVCNPLVGADYYLEQLDENGDPVSTYNQSKLDYASGTLIFTGLVAGYPFRLTVRKDGCEAVATCDDIVTTCPTALAPNSTTTAVKTVTSSSSLKEIETADFDKTITAYPVPFRDRANIEFKSARSGNYAINLYDSTGKLIKELKAGKAKAGQLQSIEVEGRNLPNGMYFIRVVDSAGSRTVKLLKKE
ncbi:T9SS type A sorting domain-containing protein [Pontibacter pudoricolor]|uniref:T9SS type A sorting domain-containing protein n=1 Tax=Pontibacter pudoricolor TaxID=2694930 RepID=UPI001390FE24|nr:T9SS type A sorting domain-containing protein [Pontibacter pudoricolor]